MVDGHFKAMGLVSRSLTYQSLRQFWSRPQVSLLGKVNNIRHSRRHTFSFRQSGFRFKVVLSRMLILKRLAYFFFFLTLSITILPIFFFLIWSHLWLFYKCIASFWLFSSIPSFLWSEDNFIHRQTWLYLIMVTESFEPHQSYESEDSSEPVIKT